MLTPDLLRHLTDNERAMLDVLPEFSINKAAVIGIITALATARAKCESEYARGVEDAVQVVEKKGEEHRSLADDLKRNRHHAGAAAHIGYMKVLIGNCDSASQRIRALTTKAGR